MPTASLARCHTGRVAFDKHSGRGEIMGLFGRKKEAPTRAAAAPVALYAWQLPADGRAYGLTNVRPETIEAILEDSGSPNRNQTARASLRPSGPSSIEVYYGEHLAGLIEGDDAATFMTGLTFLSATGRYAVVRMDVPSRKSKAYGTLSVVMPWDEVIVPFNQPPGEFVDATYRVSPAIKNTHLHVADLRRLAPLHGTPGWFVLTAAPDGGVDVYAPEYGRAGVGTKVGAVYKEDVPDTLEKMAGQPCVVQGRVLWYDKGPQIRLRY